MACDSVWNTTPIALDHIDPKALAAALTDKDLPEAERWRIVSPAGASELVFQRGWEEKVTLSNGVLDVQVRQRLARSDEQRAAQAAERDAIVAKVRQAYGAQVATGTLVRYGLKLKKREVVAETKAIKLTFNRTGR